MTKMDWKQELLKRLDALAAQLGTTGAHLWAVLIKQAYVDGSVSLLMAALLAMVIWLCVRWFKAALIAKKAAGYDGDGWIAVLVACPVGGVVAGVFLLCCINQALLELFNPEYYALSEVLKALGH